MRVRALTSFAEGFRVWNPGEEGEIPNETGVALLRVGAVERLDTVPETAALHRGEKAVRTVRPVK